jgi:RNA polymerase sigma factor (sigma-70 family)
MPQLQTTEPDHWVALLEIALAKLAPRDRDLIRRRYDLEQTYREIAGALGMTVSNVGVSLHRVERRLKKMLSRRV